MDPITLIAFAGAVVQLAIVVKGRLDALEESLKEGGKSVAKYSKNLKSFAEEVEDLRKLLDASLNRDDRRTVAEVLNGEDGMRALQQLTRAIRDSKVLVQNERNAVDLLTSLLRRKDVGIGLIKVGIFDSEHYDEFMEKMNDACDELEDKKVDIHNLFNQFEQLCSLTSSTVKRNSRMVEPETMSLPLSLEVVQTAFEVAPFQVDVGANMVPLLHSLNATRSSAESMFSRVEDVGKLWVETEVGAQVDVTTMELGRVQLELMERLAGAIEASRENSEQLLEIGQSLKSMIRKARAQKFSIAFCGMVKAGKSLFLNALVGKIVLPSSELPSTAWPCRIRHVEGQLVPTLEVNTAPFDAGIAKLKELRYGQAMVGYKPESDDIFAGILEDKAPKLRPVNPREGELRFIYTNWVDLHPETKANLLRFEEKGFQLRSIAIGEDEVASLLGEINDIVRICKRMKVEFDMECLEWPVLSIEFNSLKGQPVEGVFEFIDLPGIGESFDSYDFEDLIRGAAKEVNVVVPIVSFKEIPKVDWRKLPEIIKAGINRAPEIVLCTHLDQISQEILPEQCAAVSKVFWPASATSSLHRVVPCSSRTGLSAISLLSMSGEEKPPFEDIWDEKSMGYCCAEKILGLGNPQSGYEVMSHEDWTKYVGRQLRDSGLQQAIQKLTVDVVSNARQRELRYQTEYLKRSLHKAVSEQKRTLLEMRRSEEECHRAYNEFLVTKLALQKALNDWALEEVRLAGASTSKLTDGLNILRANGEELVKASVERSASNIPEPPLELDLKRSTDNLVFYRTSDAEMFLYNSQQYLAHSLSQLKRKFVKFVRALADRSKEQRFESLRDRIKVLSGSLPDLKKEIIEDLENRGVDLETLVFSSFKRKLTEAKIKYTAATAFRAIEGTLAKPFMKKNTVLVPGGSEETAAVLRNESLDQLGFMVRAPIAVITTIPFVLSAGFWPFMTQSKMYYLEKSMIYGLLNKHIVDPFLESLAAEGRKTLNGMMSESAANARDAVEATLKKEEERYEGERRSKASNASKVDIAFATALLVNLLAAEIALVRLQEYLQQLPVVSL